MTPELHERIMDHIANEAPREACGLLVWDGEHNAIYFPCRNVNEDAENHFRIHHEDWIDAEDSGIILGVVHSHPGASCEPSTDDVAECTRSGVPWWVFNDAGEWRRIAPTNWDTGGRPFAWGVQDCYTLAMDEYTRLPDFMRSNGFWHRKNLFKDGLEAAGFQVVEDGPQVGDAMLMSIRGGGVPNHCAIYVGAGRIRHHLPGRLSRTEYLGPLNRAVVAIVRRML